MKVKDIIKDLNDLDEVWVKGKIERLDGSDYHLVIAFNNRRCFFYKNDEIVLEKPQDDKVEIPQFLADYFNNSPNLGVGDFLDFEMSESGDKGEVERWLYDNDIEENNKRYLIACRAYVEGFTVKPKRWVVRLGGSEVWYLQGFRNSLDGNIIKQWCSYEGCIKFANKSKAEAVATLIEGSVEEV